MKTVKTRIISVFLAFAVVFGIVCSAMPTTVYAAEGSDFDKTNVLDDLTSSSAESASFDIKNFPFDESRGVQIINFVEYCYSYKVNMRANYGLYLYVYNPAGINLAKDSKSNKVQMAVAYDESGNPTAYEKFSLQCVSVSEGDYKNLFYKFKVIDRKIDGKTFVERVNSIERRYDISGIELMKYGDKTATEYVIGGTYKFTGYAAGYGPDSNGKNTLDCKSEELETLSLDVKHSNFRTNVSSLGKNHYNEVNTAYFAVPERIFDTYGRLQKIHAEWWEYKTKMATVTSSKDFYDQLINYVGVDVGEHSDAVPLRIYAEYSGTTGGIGSATIHNYGWTYNVDLSTKYTGFGSVSSVSFCDNVSNIMPYAFYAPAVSVDKVFSFLYSDPIAGSVGGNVVEEWINNYKNDLGHGYIDCNGKEISKDLFEDFVDSGRTMGYNNVNIDLADTFDLNSYDSNHTWWDKLWDYGFSWPSTDGDYKNVSPIYELKASDLEGSDEDISERLLINKDDISSLKTYYALETAKGNRIVLFRFANTDYYSAPAFRTGYTGHIDDTDTYVAQQTVFFDFDIIDLTFNKDGVYRVIPVVSSPTDVINGFDPPAQEFQWWKIILAVIMLIVLVIILFPVMPYIIKGAGFVFSLPAKGVRALKSRREEKYISDYIEYYGEDSLPDDFYNNDTEE